MDSHVEWFPQICEATCEMPRLAALDVLDSLSDEAFSKEYASRSTPFLLRLGLLKFSEAETLGLLQGAYGDQTVNVRFGNMADPGSYLNRREEEMPLRDFIGEHFTQGRNAGAAYAAGTVVPIEMARDLGFPFPMFYPEYFFNEPRMWMGKKGTVTALHKDIPDNFSFAYLDQLLAPVGTPQTSNTCGESHSILIGQVAALRPHPVAGYFEHLL